MLFMHGNRFRFEEEAEYRQKNIADQRRRWQVKHYTLSGKPDKGKPYGKTAVDHLIRMHAIYSS